jgi:hypothetical protein
MHIEDTERAEAILMAIARGEYVGEIPSFSELEFGEWATLSVYLPKPPLDSAITPPYMEAFLELQRQIHQLAAVVKTGRPNGTYLTEEEKRALEIIVQVQGGSSLLEVNFGEAVKTAMAEAAKKLSGAQITSIVLGVTLLLASGWGFSAYLEKEREVRIAEIKSAEHQETLKALSYASEKQVALLDRVLGIIARNGEEGQKAAEAVNQSYDALVKAASKTDESTINGQEIAKEDAKAIRLSPRVKAEPELVVQEFRVIDINTEDALNITAVIVQTDADEQIRVSFADSLFAARDRERMFEALKSRKPIWIELIIRKSEDRVRNVEILRVVDPPVRQAELPLNQ